MRIGDTNHDLMARFPNDPRRNPELSRVEIIPAESEPVITMRANEHCPIVTQMPDRNRERTVRARDASSFTRSEGINPDLCPSDGPAGYVDDDSADE